MLFVEQSQQLSLLGGTHPKGLLLIFTVAHTGKHLGSGEHQFYRPTHGLGRQGRQYGVWPDRTFTTKATTEVLVITLT